MPRLQSGWTEVQSAIAFKISKNHIRPLCILFRDVRFTPETGRSRTFYISRKGKSRQPERLFLSANITTDYRDFGVVSSFSGFAVLLPEPVVPGLELIALALDFCALELTALAWCRCLWLTMCFFVCLVMPVVSSLDTLVAGFELLPE